MFLAICDTIYLMEMPRTQLYFLVGIIAIVAIFGLFIVRPYLNSLVLAAVFAVVFYPLYQGIKRVTRYESLASFATVLIISILVLIPLLFFATLVFNEARGLYIATLQGNEAVTLQTLINGIERGVEKIVPNSFGFLNLSQYVKQALEWMISNMGSAFSSVAEGFVSFALSLFMLYYILKDGQKIRKFLINHSPLPDGYDVQILDRVHDAVNSVIKGSLTVAIIQGIATGTGFFLFGVPDSALWGGVATIAALVPTLGTTLVIGPGIIFLLATDHIGAGLGLAIWGMFAVGMIDNMLGPKLIGRNTHIHPLIIFLGVLGGISLFGPIGFLIGPLVFSILFVLIDAYVSLSKGVPMTKSSH